MPDAVLGNGGADVVCYGLEGLGGVAHGHARTHRLEHVQVVQAVAEGQGLGCIQAEVLQHRRNGRPLAAACRDDVHRPVPGYGDLDPRRIPEKEPVIT